MRVLEFDSVWDSSTTVWVWNRSRWFSSMLRICSCGWSQCSCWEWYSDVLGQLISLSLPPYSRNSSSSETCPPNSSSAIYRRTKNMGGVRDQRRMLLVGLVTRFAYIWQLLVAVVIESTLLLDPDLYQTPVFIIAPVRTGPQVLLSSLPWWHAVIILCPSSRTDRVETCSAVRIQVVVRPFTGTVADVWTVRLVVNQMDHGHDGISRLRYGPAWQCKRSMLRQQKREAILRTDYMFQRWTEEELRRVESFWRLHG